MKPPIVIIESDDISVHSSSEHAASHLEPVDVRDRIYVGYDSEGNLLDLSVSLVKENHYFLWFSWTREYEIVSIHDHEPRENQINELRSKLIHYLVLERNNEELSNMTIEQLIKRVGKYMPWRI